MLAEPFQVSLHVWDVVKDFENVMFLLVNCEKIIYRKTVDDGYSDAAINFTPNTKQTILHVVNINSLKSS